MEYDRMVNTNISSATTVGIVGEYSAEQIITDINTKIDDIEKKLEMVLLPDTDKLSENSPQQSILVGRLRGVYMRLNNLNNRINL